MIDRKVLVTSGIEIYFLAAGASIQTSIFLLPGYIMFFVEKATRIIMGL